MYCSRTSCTTSRGIIRKAVSSALMNRPSFNFDKLIWSRFIHNNATGARRGFTTTNKLFIIPKIYYGLIIVVRFGSRMFQDFVSSLCRSHENHMVRVGRSLPGPRNQRVSTKCIRAGSRNVYMERKRFNFANFID